MERLFEQSIADVSELHKLSDEDIKILESVDSAAEELVLSETENYLKRQFNRDAIKTCKKHGIFAIPIEKKSGGKERAPLVTMLAKERLGQVGLGLASFLNVQVFLGELTLQRWANDEQKERYLEPAVRGEKILAFGLTEPDIGSNPEAMKTTYRKKGGKFIISGSKYLITNGSVADNIILFARSSESTGEISAFIVDSKSPGFSATPLKEKIGLFTSDTAFLELKNVVVDKGDVLGKIGHGLSVAYSGLVNGRFGVSAGCIGCIEDCLNVASNRARERIQFNKPIGKHQLIQRHIAEIAKNLEMARWPAYFMAIKRAEYDKSPDNKILREDMDRRTSLAKRIASRLAFESADHAVQVLGGLGYTTLASPGRHYCDSRVTRIYEGTDEIMDLKIAAYVLGEEFKAFY